MDLTNLDTIKNIIKDNRLWPKKGYGQNFLISRNALNIIIESAQITSDDTIVEIGPGLGTLTQELAKNAKLVLALESDYNLVTYLRKYFKSAKNIKIIHQDVLTYDLRLMTNDYKLVSNLPYNISSPVIRKFLESQINADLDTDADQRGNNKLQCMVLMLQKEVAERLTAKPGSADRGILTVMVELFGGAEIIENVSRKSFYPIPDVDSAIIKININTKKLKNSKILDTKALMQFVKIGFSQKRRQIHHPLADNLHLPTDQIKDILKSVNIDLVLRAEDLNIDQWISLYKKVFN
ncbi:MAG: dimethyladenosine transferase [uncultured bacterium]|nr:MAG: dimethyladenosine transferase [uncultured bacterium]